MIKIGVIGFGYWGPNVARNFHTSPDFELAAICDRDEKSRNKAAGMFPDIPVLSDSDALIGLNNLDAVAVVTPVFTHFELALSALAAGKHVFIEKPLTSTSDQAAQLIALAEQNQKIIMVDHTFIFTGAVKKIKQLIDDNTLGELYYYDSIRINLGLFQNDINVIWDLAVHDLAVLDYLLAGNKPTDVSAVGIGHFDRPQENLAYITLFYPNGFLAHINVNWMSPVKLRTTLLAGKNKMLVWNDLEPDEKIKIYDKGVNITTTEGAYNLLVDYRSGDMYAPKLDRSEALKNEVNYFAECINRNTTPINDGPAGLRVVKILEATNRSLVKSGLKVKL